MSLVYEAKNKVSIINVEKIFEIIMLQIFEIIPIYIKK